METANELQNSPKQRHGCVTAWIIIMIAGNSITALVYLLASELITENLAGNVPTLLIILLGLVGIANVIFSVMLLQWKKSGFWGFCLTSVVALVINTNIGLDITQSLLGLIGIGVLYGILQIKKGNRSAWENLE